MNAEKRALIQDILAQENRQYIVPIYQRAYKWTTEEVTRLVRDIIKCGKSEKEHFVGSVVYQFPDKVPNLADIKLYLVDGQQRLTTLLLITKALNLIASGMSGDSDASYVVSKTNRILYIDVDDKTRGYKVAPGKRDASVFDAIISASSIEDINKNPLILKESNLYNNFIKAYNLLKSEIESGTNIKREIYDQGLLKLTAVEITLSYDEDAQEIFESINSLGVDLTNADLIRNYLLMSNSNQKAMYTDYWEPMQDTVIGESNMEEFVQHYLYVKKEAAINEKDVYKEYVAISEKLMEEKQISKDDLLKELYEMALIYEPFIKECNRYSAVTNNLMKEFRDMNQSTVYPFLIRVFMDHKNMPEIVTEKVLNDVLNLTVSYIVRRTICGVPTHSLRGFMLSLYRRVFKIEENYNRYYEAIYAYLTTIRNNDYMRSPDEVKEALVKAPLYNNLRFSTYLLYKLENGRYKNAYSEVVTAVSPTVEHIMPQTLTDEWIRMLSNDEYEPEEIHRTYINTLGNLSLSSRSKNSVMSNEEFSFKKGVLESDGSKFEVLNRDVITFEKFSIDEILEREARLSKLVLEKYDLGTVNIEGIKFEENVEVIATVEANNIFVGATPIAFRLQGTEVVVDSYARIITQVTKMLYDKYPEKIRELAKNEYNPWNDSDDAKKCLHFDENEKDTLIADNVYVNTNYQSNYSIQFCVYLMQECGVDADQLSIFLKKSSIKKENTFSKTEKVELIRSALKDMADSGEILYNPDTMPTSNAWIKFQLPVFKDIFIYDGKPITWDGEPKHNEVCFMEYNVAKHRVVLTLKVFSGTAEYVDKLNKTREILNVEGQDFSNYWHLKSYYVDFDKVVNSIDMKKELIDQMMQFFENMKEWAEELKEVVK